MRSGKHRRGLFRDLMGRALSFADARVDLVILATGMPGLYMPFGFRQVKEAARVGATANTTRISFCCPWIRTRMLRFSGISFSAEIRLRWWRQPATIQHCLC
jgi:predicted N-acetyltransferase YhbS